MNDFDSQTFKTLDASSYDSVTEEFDYFTERLSSPLARQMILHAEILSGDSVLDVGTGTGIVALLAAKKAGATGRVCGIDLSNQMLAKAEEKAQKLKFDQKIIFRQMDAEALDFEEKTFDVVVSLFALMHFPNPLTALKEIYRVLRPGKSSFSGRQRCPVFFAGRMGSSAQTDSGFCQRFTRQTFGCTRVFRQVG